MDHGWRKGDILVPKEAGYPRNRLKYLADSELDYNCFIAEDEWGDVTDDWLIENFRKEGEVDG